LKCRNEHFIFVDFDSYRKWGYLIKFLVYLNKNYKPCLIFRRSYLSFRNIVVVGLRWNGKNVKRRTIGVAKKHLQINKEVDCLYCGVRLNISNATTDHIVPISKGGNNTQVNLVICCKECNSQRGDKDFYKFLLSKNYKYKTDIPYI